MNKILILLPALILFNLHSRAQAIPGNKIYVIDLVPVIKDPEEGNEILPTDIADTTIIIHKDTLQLLGYSNYDTAIYVFTKQYRERPEYLKEIPTSKKMEEKDGAWYYHSNPYSGKYIDYFYSGKKQEEGNFQNGKAEGLRIAYHQNGQKARERSFNHGIETGIDKKYYQDGSLKEKGLFVNGKLEGDWEMYYPNGSLLQSMHFENGRIDGLTEGFFLDGKISYRARYKNNNLLDSAVNYYSSGKIREKVTVVNGKIIPDPSKIKIYKLISLGNQQLGPGGALQTAIKYYSKAIQLDKNFTHGYYSRGSVKLFQKKYDEAIADFDKALEIEPFDMSLIGRAAARAGKYENEHSRTGTAKPDVTVLSAKDSIQIPTAEREKICRDIELALSAGMESKFLTDTLLRYCRKASINK